MKNTEEFTYLLHWDPETSGVTMENWKYWLKHFPFATPRWDVSDRANASLRDHFYILKVGSGVKGIVTRGVFTSKPYLADGCRNLYCDMGLEYILNPEEGPILPIEDLQKFLPDVDWEHADSDFLLSADQKMILDALWQRFLEDHPDITKQQDRLRESYVEPSAAVRVQGFKEFYEALRPYSEQDYILRESSIYGCFNRSYLQDYSKQEFTITLWFRTERKGNVLTGMNVTFLCKGIVSVKQDPTMIDEPCGLFMLYEEGAEYLHLEANDVTVICQEIEIQQIEQCDLPACEE